MKKYLGNLIILYGVFAFDAQCMDSYGSGSSKDGKLPMKICDITGLSDSPVLVDRDAIADQIVLALNEGDNEVIGRLCLEHGEGLTANAFVSVLTAYQAAAWVPTLVKLGKNRRYTFFKAVERSLKDDWKTETKPRIDKLQAAVTEVKRLVQIEEKTSKPQFDPEYGVSTRTARPEKQQTAPEEAGSSSSDTTSSMAGTDRPKKKAPNKDAEASTSSTVPSLTTAQRMRKEHTAHIDEKQMEQDTSPDADETAATSRTEKGRHGPLAQARELLNNVWCARGNIRKTVERLGECAKLGYALHELQGTTYETWRESTNEWFAAGTKHYAAALTLDATAVQLMKELNALDDLVADKGYRLGTPLEVALETGGKTAKVSTGEEICAFVDQRIKKLEKILLDLRNLEIATLEIDIQQRRLVVECFPCPDSDTSAKAEELIQKLGDRVESIRNIEIPMLV